MNEFKLNFSGIRCFKSPQSIPIRPLTLLVGENSTGKSTVLAIIQMAFELCEIPPGARFNREPFELGAYDQIAHYHGGQGKRARELTIGLSVESSSNEAKSPNSEATSIKATFIKKFEQPSLAKITIHRQTGNRTQIIKYDPQTHDITIESNDWKEDTGDLEKVLFKFLNEFSNVHSNQLDSDMNTHSTINKKNASMAAHISAMTKLKAAIQSEILPIAIAPVRAQPRRTYDPIRLSRSAAGSHVPGQLAQMSKADKGSWEAICNKLDDFGRRSGLYEQISLSQKGHLGSDPFQLDFKIGGFPFNIRDIGYGVGQVLPILVDSLQSPRNCTILMQQPEVHLHPRAQAQLGTILSAICKEHEKRFIIETHSDYIIDRIRTEVRTARTLVSKDVVILYFERKGADIKIFPITISEEGDLVGAPDSYRNFFIAERQRFMGIE